MSVRVRIQDRSISASKSNLKLLTSIFHLQRSARDRLSLRTLWVQRSVDGSLQLTAMVHNATTTHTHSHNATARHTLCIYMPLPL